MPSARRGDGMTPLRLCAIEGCGEIAKMLLSRGADSEAVANRGAIVSLALRYRHADIAAMVRAQK